MTSKHDHGAGVYQALRLRVGQHDAVVTFGSGDPHQCGFADASSTQTKSETGIATDTAAVRSRFLRFSADSV